MIFDLLPTDSNGYCNTTVKSQDEDKTTGKQERGILTFGL